MYGHALILAWHILITNQAGTRVGMIGGGGAREARRVWIPLRLLAWLGLARQQNCRLVSRRFPLSVAGKARLALRASQNKVSLATK